MQSDPELDMEPDESAGWMMNVMENKAVGTTVKSHGPHGYMRGDLKYVCGMGIGNTYWVPFTAVTDRVTLVTLASMVLLWAKVSRSQERNVSEIAVLLAMPVLKNENDKTASLKYFFPSAL